MLVTLVRFCSCFDFIFPGFPFFVCLLSWFIWFKGDKELPSPILLQVFLVAVFYIMGM